MLTRLSVFIFFLFCRALPANLPAPEIIPFWDETQVDALAKRIREGDKNLEGACFFHLDGKRSSPSFERLLYQLSESDFNPPAITLPRKEFEAALSDLRESLPDEKDIQHFLVQFEAREGALPVKTKQKLESALKRQKILTRLRDTVNRFFGTPLGITWMETHCYRVDEKQKKKWRFGIDGKRGLQTVAITTGALVALTADLFFQGRSLTDSSSLETYAWIAISTGLLTQFSREISSWEVQGRRFWFNREAPQGKQLMVDHALPLILSSLFIKNLLVNCVSIALLGDHSFLADLAMNGAAISAVRAFSEMLTEKWKAIAQLREEKAFHAGDQKGVERSSRVSAWIAYIWGAVLAPALSLLPVAAKGDGLQGFTIAAGVFSLVGLGTILFEKWIAEDPKKTLLHRWKLKLPASDNTPWYRRLSQAFQRYREREGQVDCVDFVIL